MTITLEISSVVHNAIISIMNEEFISERIGLCFGTITGDKFIKISNFVEIDNLDFSPNSFSLDYGKMMELIDLFRKENESFIGIFHCHPPNTSPLPSKKDKFFMYNWPFPFIWLIGVFPQILAFYYSQKRIFQLPYILYDI